MTRPLVDPAAALAALADRRPLDVPALMLVAHPDDEVLGCSIALRGLTRLRLVHGTDGSGGDHALTATRMREVAAALDVLGARPTLAPVGLPDGALVTYAATLADALAAWLPETALVITHAYEGGHPDHDACALAAQIACARVDHQVARLEFPIYARSGGAVRTNAFPPDAAPAPTVLTLTTEERARKGLALQAFATQRHVVERFPVRVEQLRAAPTHDFTRPRDAGELLFAVAAPEREPAWRSAARAALSK